MKALSLVLTVFISLQSFAVTQTECEQRTGYRWDENLGCITTQQVLDTREGANECADKTGDELKECTKRVAQEMASDLDKEHKNSLQKDEGLIYGAALTTVLGTGFLFLKTKKSGAMSSCTKTSLWLMLGGSIAALSGEIIARVKYNKKLKDAGESYNNYEAQRAEEMEATDDERREELTNKQIRAFDYLIDIEKARESAERVRRTLYTAAMASFGAATLASFYEAIEESLPSGSTTSGLCKISSVDNNNNVDIRHIAKHDSFFRKYLYLEKVTASEFIELALKKASSLFISDSLAAGGEGTIVSNIKPNGIVTTPAPKPSVNIQEIQESMEGVSRKLKAKIDSSLQKAQEERTLKKSTNSALLRGAIGIGLTTASTLLRKQAKNNIEISRSRQSELAEIRDVFRDTGGSSLSRCTEEMSEDQNNPICYCYNTDGSKDMRKSNLKICDDVWGSGYTVTKNNYDARNGNAGDNTRTCITKSYEADITCKCKSNDSCLKTSSPNFNYGGVAWAAPIVAQNDALYSNGLESAGLEEGNYENQARAISKKIDELSKNPKYKDIAKKTKSLSKRLRSNSLKNYRSSPNNFSSQGLAAFDQAPMDIAKKSPKEILKEAEKLSKRNTQSFSTGKKAKAFDLDFGDSNNTGIEIQDDVAQVMDKEFKIKGDINNNPDHNIFKILSNRYKSTGLKRLFDEE